MATSAYVGGDVTSAASCTFLGRPRRRGRLDRLLAQVWLQPFHLHPVLPVPDPDEEGLLPVLQDFVWASMRQRERRRRPASPHVHPAGL